MLLLLFSEDPLFHGRPDFVHRPAASLASLYFQNDFFLVITTVASRSALLIWSNIVNRGKIFTRHGFCRVALVVFLCEFPSPKLNHKGDSVGTAQHSSLFAIIRGTDLVGPQKAPQVISNLGNLSVSDNQGRGQSWIDFGEFGNLRGINLPAMMLW